MTYKNIGYHTRLLEDNRVKVVGGSFGGELSLETANHLVNSQFTVVVKPSGTPVFVDSKGREVRLYISVDVEATDIGKVAMGNYRREKYLREEKEQKMMEDRESELQNVMSGMSHEEVIRRLKNDF